MTEVTHPVAYSIADAARAVGVSPSLIRRAIHSGGGAGELLPLRASLVGRSYRVLHEDLVAWVEGQRV